MSATVVVIGFILLIPSVFGMLVGVSMLFITGAAGTQTSNVGERNIRVRLVGQHVPEPIIAKVMASKPVRNSELASLSLEQQSAIHDAQSSVSAHKAGAGAATIIAGGLSLLIIFTSFVGGLVGWLLIMRKRVLQCVRCGAVVPGS